MLDLILVRHTATALNDTRRYQGHVDPPLTRAGEARAAALWEELNGRLASLADRRATPASAAATYTGADDPTRAVRRLRVYTSDLRRAHRTAALALPGVVATPDPRLRELDFGEFDGADYAENLRRHGDRFRAWIADPAAAPPPGGEALGEFEARVLAWLREQPAGGIVVAFTHGGPIRVLLAHGRGVPFDHVDAAACRPGEILHLELNREMA